MSRSSSVILSEEFLQTRAKILEVAAFFDRLANASSANAASGTSTSGVDGDDRQLQLLRQGCRILNDDQPDKAARLQLLFSREYNAQWRQQFGI